MAEPQGQEGPSQALLREPVPHSELDERWGPESVGHITLLNKVAVDTEKTTQEERDEHFRVMREEIIPLLNRCEAVLPMERKEAFAVFEKYHAQGTGVRDTLVKEYDTLLKDLDARMPLLAKALRAAHPKRPLNNDQIVSFENDNEAPFVIFNNTGYANAVAVQLEHHRATRALLFKKVALMKNQNDALTRALVKNGIQLPHECATIQEQLQALKDFSPDESAPGNTGRDVTSELPSEAANPEETGSEIEQRRDPLPGHKLVTLSEDPSGSGTTGYWQCSTDSPVVEEEAVAREMNGAELQDLLQSLHRYNCGQYFEKPLTEEESPEYFDVVKDHRDLSTIKDDLGKDPEYSACEFFFDLRLMIDNYSHVFGEGSEERRMVNLFQEVMLKKLEGYGEAGQIAKVCELPAAALSRSCTLSLAPILTEHRRLTSITHPGRNSIKSLHLRRPMKLFCRQRLTTEPKIPLSMTLKPRSRLASTRPTKLITATSRTIALLLKAKTSWTTMTMAMTLPMSKAQAPSLLVPLAQPSIREVNMVTSTNLPASMDQLINPEANLTSTGLGCSLTQPRNTIRSTAMPLGLLLAVVQPSRETTQIVARVRLVPLLAQPSRQTTRPHSPESALRSSQQPWPTRMQSKPSSIPLPRRSDRPVLPNRLPRSALAHLTTRTLSQMMTSPP